MAAIVGSKQDCWLCGGCGHITTGDSERRIFCGACSGLGVTDEVPCSTAEMVSMLADLPDIERITLTTEDLARINEIEQVVIQCLLEIEAEESER